MIYDARSLKSAAPGMRVWATAYALNGDRTAVSQRVPPVQGELSAVRRDWPGRTSRASGGKPVKYFVPYGKTGRPMWSKAVRLESRMYADTEDEAVMLYDMLINEEAKALRELACEIAKDRLPSPGNQGCHIGNFVKYVLPCLKFDDSGRVPSGSRVFYRNRAVSDVEIDAVLETVTFATPNGDFCFPFAFLNALPDTWVMAVPDDVPDRIPGTRHKGYMNPFD